MEELPPCKHERLEIIASWQADLAARVVCKVCGADAGLTAEEEAEYDRLAVQDPQEAGAYLMRKLPE